MVAEVSLALFLLVGLEPSKACRAPERVGAAEALTMRLQLRVRVAGEDGKPSAHVAVRFVDTAAPPRQRDEGRLLGMTDEAGVFDAAVVHVWPDYFRKDRRPDAGTFDILVANQVFHGAVECLPELNGERTMTIQVVAKSDVIVITDAARVGGRRTSG